MENSNLKKDKEWSIIDGKPCKVINFTPLATIENGKVIASNKTEPYASVILECKKLPQQTKGFICHKMDFQHLWAAFKERGVRENEEVIIFYSKKHYKLKLLRFLPGFWPKLWVMICQKGAFKLITDSNYKPELQGEARYKAEKPIIDWKPEIME